MIDLTIAQVSGIIAAGGFIVQFFIPTVTALILAGLLTDDNTLMTWTQAARAFHSSLWPLLVRADFTIIGPVANSVTTEAIVRPLLLLVLAVATIVSPLGLYDAVVPDADLEPVRFVYKEDPSPFGYGTPRPHDLGFNRQCGFARWIPCPGISNDTESNGSYDMTIPESIIETFQSGLERFPATVSSTFDIEYRTYAIARDPKKNNGSAYAISAYRQIETLVLRNGYEIIEGLVVDMKNGGVGFRSHSFPESLDSGSSWSEDLLFVEPETYCLSMNLTLDFTLPPGDATLRPKNLVLTDRGGFSELNQTYPRYDRTDPQQRPDLPGRARMGAYLFNAYTMAFMNITSLRTNDTEAWAYMNSKIGDSFPVNLTSHPDPHMLLAMNTWDFFSDLTIHLPNLNITSERNSTYPNPFNITTADFTGISTMCQGAAGGDIANITNIGVVCGLVMGAPRRSGKSDPLVLESGSEWSAPLYSCASVSKASIKTVDFTYNGTAGLASLKVDDIRPKEYKDDAAKPLWGVEQPGMLLRDIYPLWGLVADRYQARDDLAVVRKEWLYLPGSLAPWGLPVNPGENNPAASFHLLAFQTAYTVDGSAYEMADYSGRTNIAMYSKWRDLSEFANTTSHVINSIWTDVVANTVMGSRGWIQRNAAGPQKRADTTSPVTNGLLKVPVKAYRRKVRYHAVYGIPAFIVLGAAAIIGAAAFLMWIVGYATPADVRRHLFNTAVGRIMASFTYPGQAHPHAKTRHWNELVGDKEVSMATLIPQATEPHMVPLHENKSSNDMEYSLLRHRAAPHPAPSPSLHPPSEQWTEYRPYSPL